MSKNLVHVIVLDDPEIDQDIFRAERHMKDLQSRIERKNSLDPEYRRRLQENGLGDVLANFIRKGE